MFGPEGSALFALDGYDLAIDMSKIRQAVQLDKETFTIKRETSQAVFWDGVVENYVEARKRQKVSTWSFTGECHPKGRPSMPDTSRNAG